MGVRERPLRGLLLRVLWLLPAIFLILLVVIPAVDPKSVWVEALILGAGGSCGR